MHQASVMSGLLAVALAWSATMSGRADPPPSGEDPALQKLIGEYESAQQAWFAQVEKLEQEGKLDRDNLPPGPQAEFVPRFRTYAEQHAGTPQALPALAWLLENPIMGKERPEPASIEWSVGQLAASHAADPAIASLVRSLQLAGWVLGRKPVVDLCETIRAQNPDAQVRSSALYTTALTLFDGWLPKEGRDPGRAAKLFREYLAANAEGDFATSARSYLYEIEHLEVGMKAPQISGQSPGGDEVRLSQYLGQVVVVDFWGFW